jgi:hypothetical protein
MKTAFDPAAAGSRCAAASPPWPRLSKAAASGDDTCRISDACDFPVRCREGTLWITSSEDPGDTVVAAGEQLSVTSGGTVMVAALVPSSMWVPEGFAVDDAEDTATRRIGLRKLGGVTAEQCPGARASDEPRRPRTAMLRLAPFQKLIMIISRILAPSTDAAEAPGRSVRGAFRRAVAALARRSATGTADARERYLSQSVDHADFENRIRTWDAHEARLRRLPPVR